MYQVATFFFTVIYLHSSSSLYRTAECLRVLARLLRVGDVPGTRILLLALANILGQFFLIFLSLVALKNVAPGLSRSLVRPFLDGCIAAIAGGSAAYGALAILGGIAPLTTLVSRLHSGICRWRRWLFGVGARAVSLEKQRIFRYGNRAR